jgi:hypothetical protein
VLRGLKDGFMREHEIGKAEVRREKGKSKTARIIKN